MPIDRYTKAVLTVIAVALVTGCETDAGPSEGEVFRKNVYSWIGRSEADLVTSAGPPTAVATIDGGDRVLSWDLAASRPTPGALLTGPANTLQYIPGPYVPVSCRVTYRISAKAVVAASVSQGC